MNTVQNPPLPNAADKAALKALAAHVVQACPSLHDTAHEVAAMAWKSIRAWKWIAAPP